MLRLALAGAGALGAAACAGPGLLRATALARPASPATVARPPLDVGDETLAAYAPIVFQEVGLARLDRPTSTDPDGSGSLVDDGAALDRLPETPVPFYAWARADAERLYLFYALYYPVDWSGDARAPRIDHVGDLEGALLVVARKSGRVEAVATQAHRRYYLWLAEGESLPPAASGSFAVSSAGRPLLFAESGGHGLYSFGFGRWSPRGGNRYPEGTAAVPARRLSRIEVGAAAGERTLAAVIRPLDDLRAFTLGARGPFRGLPRGARPPWLWDDKGRRGLPAGLIVDDPGRLLEALGR